MIACLWLPAWPHEAAHSPLLSELLAVVPRVTITSDVIWADIDGLPDVATARALLACAQACGVADARAGVARVPVVAELAARNAPAGTVVCVPEHEREFIAELPLTLLGGDERLLMLLDGVGVSSCGALAALEREAVEVRFGADAVRLWQWSRADDERRLFRTVPPERLHAGTDFVDYVVSDAERLIFVANALFTSLCDRLRAAGQHARAITITLSLANGASWQRRLKPARPTASRAVWLRLARSLLERLTVPDAVTGMILEVTAAEPAAAVQGDLFDVGFATAAAVENAVARLAELQGNIVVVPDTSSHPLVEKRTQWLEQELASAQPLAVPVTSDMQPELRLQLLREPREVLVETVNRRDHVVPIRFRDGHWKQIVTAAGPDRLSGGKWDEPYAREYFRVVTVDGLLAWIYRDARSDRWYLHGFWD